MEHVKSRIEHEQIENRAAVSGSLYCPDRVSQVYSLGDAALVPLKKGATRFRHAE